MKRVILILVFVFGIAAGALADGGGTTYYHEPEATEYSVRQSRESASEDARNTRILIWQIGLTLFLTQIVSLLILNWRSRKRLHKARDQILFKVRDLGGYLTKKLEPELGREEE